MNYLPKSNGKENCLKSRFCLSCKNDEMSLRPFWHNTVDVNVEVAGRDEHGPGGPRAGPGRAWPWLAAGRAGPSSGGPRFSKF